MKLLLQFLLASLLIFATQSRVNACHALAVQDYTLSNGGGGSINVNASSTSPTCGCGAYWLDVEIRCLGEAFDAGPFDPTQYLALNNYPYFQSAQMMKPNCVVQAYPTVNIPYGNLCPGIDYQVRVRENNNGNGGPWSNALTFTIPGQIDPLVGDISATNVNLCSGDCTDITASVIGGCGLAPTYSWNTGQTTPSINVCPAQTTTYTVTITEQCSNLTVTESITVYVVPTPIAGTATATPNSVCAGQTTNLTLAGFDGNIQWESAPNAGGPWTPMNGATTDNETSPPINNDMCFRAVVSGCGPSDISNVVCVTISPAPTLTVSNETICAGEPATLTTTVSTGGGTYLWNPSNQTSADLTNVYPGVTTTYDVEYSLNGCTVTASGTVTVVADPVASFDFVNECMGTDIAMNSTSTIAPPGTIQTYEWDIENDGTVDYTTNSITHGYGTAGTYDVTLYVETDEGCSDQITQTVEAFPIADVDFSATPLCLGNPTDFTDQTVVPNGGAVNAWNWNFDDGNTSTQQNPQNTYPTPGIYDVSLSVTTDNGCTSSTSIPIEIFVLPVADFTVNDDCVDQAISFQNTSQGNANNFEWDFGDGSALNNQENPSHQYNTAGQYNVTFIISTDDGCADTVELPATAYAMPTADFSVNPVCLDNVSNFADASMVTPVAGDAINGWSWDFGDGNTSTIQNPTNNYGSENSYNVSLTVSTNYGCTDTYSTDAVVWPLPDVDFSPTDVCLDEVSNFQDMTTISSQYTNNSITGWDWDFGDGGTSTQQNPTYTYTTDGSFNATLTATSNNGCVNDLTQTVTVHPTPEVSFTGQNLSGCSPVCFSLTSTSTVASQGSIVDYEWNFSNGATYSSGSPNLQDCFENNSGNSEFYGVELVVTSDQGCTNSHTEANYIVVYHNPIANFTYSPDEVDIMDPSVSINNGSQYADNYNWTVSNYGTSTDYSPTFDWSPEPDSQFIQLIVSTDEGCFDTANAVVNILDRLILYVPNTFTPDFDDFNQTFQPVFTAGFDPYNFNMKIYDRWGEIVFESNDAEIGWDGTYGATSEDLVRDGTYIWKIEFKETGKDKRQIITGHVNVLK